ncbi:hypothetical protein SNE40_002821 [Patella caerulea]|uniref:Uncharacterized protein n=1 Tax=Patella caerulea TaxID=87958 RepID=A0AAN8PZP2_PATCE
MRDNLLFFGIEELPDENTENVIKEFIRDKLNIDENVIKEFIRDKLNIDDRISIERCHRLGTKIRGKNRSIVAKFTYYKDREVVRAAAPANLKDTHYGIAEQHPAEIAIQRKALYPIYKKAKAEKRDAKLYYDKLYI